MTRSELRHFCRHCRSKLEAPVANHREAFCISGCHKSFYRHRCIVCEREMPRLNEKHKTCYRAECKKTWAKKTLQSRFIGGSSAPDKIVLENPIKHGVKEADKYGRRWVIVAGSLSPNAATVPDGPGCKWEGGSFERLAKLLAAAEKAEIEASEPDWKEVISPDGVRCFVASSPAPLPALDGLSMGRRKLKPGLTPNEQAALMLHETVSRRKSDFGRPLRYAPLRY
jgi:hypothetical protein